MRRTLASVWLPREKERCKGEWRVKRGQWLAEREGETEDWEEEEELDSVPETGMVPEPGEW